MPELKLKENNSVRGQRSQTESVSLDRSLGQKLNQLARVQKELERLSSLSSKPPIQQVYLAIKSYFYITHSFNIGTNM